MTISRCPPDAAGELERLYRSFGVAADFPRALLARPGPARCEFWRDAAGSVLIARIGWTVLAVYKPGCGSAVAEWLCGQQGIRQMTAPASVSAELLACPLPAHKPPVAETQAELHQLAHSEAKEAGVQRATAGDAGKLRSVYPPSSFNVGEFLPFEQRFELALSCGRMYYVEREGQAVAACHTLPEAAGIAQIMGVVTAPAWRGKGLARIMMNALCRDLLADGCTPRLFYETENAVTRKLYHSLGFQDCFAFTTIDFLWE